jgi:hypothetical protein
MRTVATAGFRVFCAIACAACSDPIVDDARDALGPEQAGVPKGPLHRPGQPCLVCHDDSGPGELVMSLAGTVYKYPDTLDPLSGAFVDFIDSRGRTFTAATNCAGNFFVQPADYDPHFPVWTSVRYGGVTVDMSTAIFRDGSCASCHAHHVGPESAGQVYFAPTHEAVFPADGCRR